jgi:hypothetical protein
MELALDKTTLNPLRVDDLLFTRRDQPARMRLVDLTVNVNHPSLAASSCTSPQIVDSIFAAIDVRSFPKA